MEAPSRVSRRHIAARGGVNMCSKRIGLHAYSLQEVRNVISGERWKDGGAERCR